jgi:hypothetical protein
MSPVEVSLHPYVKLEVEFEKIALKIFQAFERALRGVTNPLKIRILNKVKSLIPSVKFDVEFEKKYSKSRPSLWKDTSKIRIEESYGFQSILM